MLRTDQSLAKPNSEASLSAASSLARDEGRCYIAAALAELAN
jgi:hypothetical protein